MSAFSDEMAQVALESLVEFGEVAVFQRYTKSGYSTGSLTHATSTPATQSVNTLPYDSLVKAKDGVTVLDVEKTLLTPNTDIAGVAFAPIEGDFVTIGSTKYRVKHVQDPVRLNGVSVLYILKIGI